MSRNGSGVQTSPGASFPAVASTLIESAKFNAVINDINSVLTTSVASDGQTVITGNLQMNSNKLTGVANGSARTDSIALGQVQDSTVNWIVAGGTADAITATYVPAISALVDGQLCFVRAGAANTTTTPTFSPNGLTARTIVKYGNQALEIGSIRGIGHELILRYDLTNTRWELLNPITKDIVGNVTGNVTGSSGSCTGNAATATLATTATTVSTTISSGATGTTQTAGDNSTKIATTAYVDRLGIKPTTAAWQSLTFAFGSTYQNTETYDVSVAVYGTNGSQPHFQVSSDNATWFSVFQFQSAGSGCIVQIPAGHYYRTTVGGGAVYSASILK